MTGTDGTTTIEGTAALNHVGHVPTHVDRHPRGRHRRRALHPRRDAAAGPWLVRRGQGKWHVFQLPIWSALHITGFQPRRPDRGPGPSNGSGSSLVGADGGIFTVGGAPFLGSLPASTPTRPLHRRHRGQPQRPPATGWSAPTAASSASRRTLPGLPSPAGTTTLDTPIVGIVANPLSSWATGWSAPTGLATMPTMGASRWACWLGTEPWKGAPAEAEDAAVGADQPVAPGAVGVGRDADDGSGRVGVLAGQRAEERGASHGEDATVGSDQPRARAVTWGQAHDRGYGVESRRYGERSRSGS